MKPLTLSPVRQQINLRAQKEFWLVGFAVFSVNRPFRWLDLIFGANTFQVRPWTLSAFTRIWKNDYNSMKIYYEQCYVDSNEMTSLSILLSAVFGIFFLHNHLRVLTRAWSYNNCLNVRDVWTTSVRAFWRCFVEVFMPLIVITFWKL